MNLKDLIAKKKVADNQRIEDFIRSGGSGSMRNSLFSRTDETVTKEMVQTFKQNFEGAGGDIGIKGGPMKGNEKKQVISVWLKLPDKVQINRVDALLAKVDYDKEKKTFKAYYRPKNGKWGQSESTGEEID